MAKCEGIRNVKNHGHMIDRICLQESKYECNNCDAPLCLKCTYVASRHRRKCYGGKNIDKKEFATI